MRCRMRELVLLIVPIPQRDEDAEVVCARGDSDARSGKLCAELIETAGDDALLGTVDVEGGHGRMVGGLLGEVGDLDGLARGRLAAES